MADLFAPVQLTRAAFEDLVRCADEGIAKGAIALSLDEDYPFRELTVLNEDAVQVEGIAAKDLVPLIESMDQLTLLAFEHAPDDVVERWANRWDESLKGEAVERVRYVRENMPNVRHVWESKSTSILPPLVSFSFETMREEEGVGAAVAVYIAAARVGNLGAPDRTDAVRLRIQLWLGDVNMLIKNLTHIRDAHLSPGAAGGDEADDSSE